MLMERCHSGKPLPIWMNALLSKLLGYLFRTTPLLLMVSAACAPFNRQKSMDHPLGAVSPPYTFEKKMLASSKLTPDAHLSIQNRWGDIRLRNHAEPFVRIDAAIQRIGLQAPAPSFVTAETVHAYAVEVQAPEGRLEPRNIRVDIVAFIPQGMSATLLTIDGAVESKKTHNKLLINTDSGAVKVTNQGELRAISRSGAIQAQPMAPGWGGVELHTAGDVTLFVPDSPHVSIHILRAMSVDSEFPMRGNQSGPWVYLPAVGSDQILVSTHGQVQIYKTLVDPRRSPVNRQ